MIEIGSSVSTQLAAMVMADFGAEVIRVELADVDPARQHPAYRMRQRGKYCLPLDLRQPDAQRAMSGWLESADVLLCGLKPSSRAALGLDRDTLARDYPKLIDCAVSGFGAGSPYDNIPAYEGVVAAKAGRMYELSVLENGERPVYAGVPIGSYGAAMLALQGVFIALRTRLRSGRGQRVETSVLQALTCYDLVNWLPKAPMRLRLGDRPFLPYLPARTRDGVWLQFAQLSPSQFRAFMKALDLLSVYDDPRYAKLPRVEDPEANRELRARLLGRIVEHDWAYWSTRFAGSDFAVEPFRLPLEAMKHEQLRHTGDVVRVQDPELGESWQLGVLADFSGVEGQPQRLLAHVNEPLSFNWPASDRSSSDESNSDGFARRQHDAAGDAGRAVPVDSDPPEDPALPLKGVTVLELATWVATPLGATLLSDLGARVIKVEPLEGDPFRHSHGAYLKTLQGKESLCLDLKTPEGRDIMHKLAATADVLVHNYRGAVPKRLGIDTDTLRAINPRLIHVYGASYGSSGPSAMRPAYHPTAGALCGEALLAGGPALLPTAMPDPAPEELARVSRLLELANETTPDPSAGLALASAISMALYCREQSGRAPAVELRMMGANAYVLSGEYIDYAGRPEARVMDTERLGLAPLYRLYRAKTGWVFLAAPSDDDFRQLAEALDRSGWLADERYNNRGARADHREALEIDLEALFSQQDADHWEGLLTARGVACVRADIGPVARFVFTEGQWTEALVSDARTASGKPYRRYAPGLRFADGQSARAESAGAPRLGASTIAILEELGYGKAQIDEWRQRRVVQIPKARPSS